MKIHCPHCWENVEIKTDGKKCPNCNESIGTFLENYRSEEIKLKEIENGDDLLEIQDAANWDRKYGEVKNNASAL